MESWESSHAFFLHANSPGTRTQHGGSDDEYESCASFNFTYDWLENQRRSVSLDQEEINADEKSRWASPNHPVYAWQPPASSAFYGRKAVEDDFPDYTFGESTAAGESPYEDSRGLEFDEIFDHPSFAASDSLINLRKALPRNGSGREATSSSGDSASVAPHDTTESVSDSDSDEGSMGSFGRVLLQSLLLEEEDAPTPPAAANASAPFEGALLGNTNHYYFSSSPARAANEAAAFCDPRRFPDEFIVGPPPSTSTSLSPSSCPVKYSSNVTVWKGTGYHFVSIKLRLAQKRRAAYVPFQGISSTFTRVEDVFSVPGGQAGSAPESTRLSPPPFQTMELIFETPSSKSSSDASGEAEEERETGEVREKIDIHSIIPISKMKADPKYRTVDSKVVKETSERLLSKFANKSAHNSRFNLNELSIFLGFQKYSVKFTAEIEKNILRILKDWCNFPVGQKSWIRGTCDMSRARLLNHVLRYTKMCYPELKSEEVEIIIRRGCYNAKQAQLRYDRRRRQDPNKKFLKRKR